MLDSLSLVIDTPLLFRNVRGDTGIDTGVFVFFHHWNVLFDIKHKHLTLYN